MLKFHCPKCGADLRDVGVEVHDWGRQVIKIKFTKQGRYDTEDKTKDIELDDSLRDEIIVFLNRKKYLDKKIDKIFKNLK